MTAAAQSAPGALAGVRVLDLSRVLAGPLCTMILGDLGADVIKVERPGVGDETRHWGPPWVAGERGRESAYFLSVNRNKRSVVADLGSPEGQALVRRLAREADVLVENYVPGTLARWGLDYESLAADNPGLVYCTISGYGTDGPASGRPGYDFAVQARGGWMAVTGEPDGEPMKAGVAVVDVLTAQNAAIGILAALHERRTSARGQRLEIALIDSAIAGLVNVTQAALAGATPRRWGNAHVTIVPYQSFQAADRPLIVAVGNDNQWRKMCSVLEVPELATDPRFDTNPSRVVHREELIPILARLLQRRTADEWIAMLEPAGVPCGPVQSVEEAIRDPSFVERGGIWRAEGAAYGDLEMVASPVRLGRTPPTLRRPPPTLGQHVDEGQQVSWEPLARPG